MAATDTSRTPQDASAASARGGTWRRIRPDVLGLSWVVAAAFAILAPALSRGAGIYDPGNALDQLDALVPWTTQVWTQVHHGTLPLWNPYSALGLPLAFNWQAAPLSLPTLVGYLFPLHLAFTVQIVVTLLTAGTGVYIFARALGLSVLACTFAAIAFELSGPFMGWLGQPVAAVMSWAGWLFFAALLVIKGVRRTRAIVLFAVILALAIYAGQPETLVQLLLALLIYLVVAVAVRSRWIHGETLSLRSMTDLAVAGTIGIGMAAPLVLPGVQLALHSLQSVPALNNSQRSSYSLDGLYYAFTNGTYSNGAYVGLICICLAVVALIFNRRRPEVVGLGVVALATAIASVTPLVSTLDGLPYLGDLHWARAEVLMAFAVALLAGTGLDVLATSTRTRLVGAWTALTFAIVGLMSFLIFFLGAHHLDHLDAVVRTRTVIWRALETGAGLAAGGALLWSVRRTRPEPNGTQAHRAFPILIGCALLLCETTFLVAAGADTLSSSTQNILTSRPAYRELQRAVGSSIVGFGDARFCFPYSLGILQDANTVYGVQELSVLDPMTPSDYVRSWHAATGALTGKHWLFCPAVTTTKAARRFGVRFVLEPAGAPGPTGTVFSGSIGNSQLYRVPGAATATLVPETSALLWPGPDAAGPGIPFTRPDSGSWRLTTNSARAGVLRLRLTDVPGWHATIDGRPLELHSFLGIMFQARIPAGHHVIQLRYWPKAFSVGLLLAGAGVASLAAFPLVTALHTRRRRRTSHA